MEIKNFIKKKLIAKIMLLSVAVGGLFINQSLPAHAEDASNNTKTVNESNYDGDDIYAGVTSSGDASNNKLTVSDITSSANQIDAGLTSSGDSSNNVTNINNVNAPGAFIHGGYATGTGNAEHNTVNFNGGTVYHLHGGHASNGNALYSLKM